MILTVIDLLTFKFYNCLTRICQFLFIFQSQSESIFTLQKRTQTKVKRRNILNLKAHELRNFENESELENFYCWRQSLSPAIEDLAVVDVNEYGEDSEMTVQLPHPEQERYKDQLASQEELMNPTEIQKSEYDPIMFDKFYRNHVFLPKFVKCHIPIEKYTETKLATLEADKESLNIKYTADDLSYGKLMKLLDQELVPIDISPELVTEIVVNNGQLSNDEILETLSAIFDLCIKNKVMQEKKVTIELAICIQTFRHVSPEYYPYRWCNGYRARLKCSRYR